VVERSHGGSRPFKIVGAEWIKTLAIAANVGVDVGWMLNLDPLARDLAVKVVEEGIDLAYKRDRRQAQMIIEELSQAMKR
jgi:hypothetical protein